MSVCFRPTSHQDEGELTSLSLSNLIIDLQAFASVVALVAAATGAPVANLLAGGHAGLVGGHGLVSGPGAFVGGHGLVGGPGLVGGVGPITLSYCLSSFLRLVAIKNICVQLPSSL